MGEPSVRLKKVGSSQANKATLIHGQCYHTRESLERSCFLVSLKAFLLNSQPRTDFQPFFSWAVLNTQMWTTKAIVLLFSCNCMVFVLFLEWPLKTEPETNGPLIWPIFVANDHSSFFHWWTIHKLSNTTHEPCCKKNSWPMSNNGESTCGSSEEALTS